MPHRPPTHKPLPKRVWRDPRLDPQPAQPKRPWQKYDRAWERLSRQVLSEQPWCADCARRGLNVRSAEAHHILKVRDNPQLRLDRRNVMALCKACHTDRTNRGE